MAQYQQLLSTDVEDPESNTPIAGSSTTKRASAPSKGRVAHQLAIKLVRTKDKFVPLPEVERRRSFDSMTSDLTSSVFTKEGADTATRGRIGVYCVAESFNRKKLEAQLRVSLSAGEVESTHSYPDVLHYRFSRATNSGAPSDSRVTSYGDIFVFDYGVCVTWGLTQPLEAQLLKTIILPSAVGVLEAADQESDAFEVHYSRNEPPNISNDCITIARAMMHDHVPKLSISHALSQSTKLLKFESRVAELVSVTKEMPASLATTGRVSVSRKRIAQLIGRVFIQKAAVNLLSTVLDTPDFFWSAPDSQQALYKRVCDYLELATRVEVLNTRFAVLTEMLHIVADHMNNSNTSRLEVIVIVLIIIEVGVGLFECASILGYFRR